MTGITSDSAFSGVTALNLLSLPAGAPAAPPSALLAAAATLGHFPALLLFAVLMSIAFALLGRTSARDRVRFALRCFLLFVGAALLLGWLMFPFSR